MIWTVVIVIVEVHITVEQTGIIVSVCRCAFYPYKPIHRQGCHNRMCLCSIWLRWIFYALF